MTMISCKECSKRISSTARACPGCGAKTRKSRTWVYALGAIPIAFIIIVIAHVNSPGYKSRIAAQESIKECWRDALITTRNQSYKDAAAEACRIKEYAYAQDYGR